MWFRNHEDGALRPSGCREQQAETHQAAPLQSWSTKDVIISLFFSLPIFSTDFLSMFSTAPHPHYTFMSQRQLKLWNPPSQQCQAVICPIFLLYAIEHQQAEDFTSAKWSVVFWTGSRFSTEDTAAARVNGSRSILRPWMALANHVGKNALFTTSISGSGRRAAVQ